MKWKVAALAAALAGLSFASASRQDPAVLKGKLIYVDWGTTGTLQGDAQSDRYVVEIHRTHALIDDKVDQVKWYIPAESLRVVKFK